MTATSNDAFVRELRDASSHAATTVDDVTKARIVSIFGGDSMLEAIRTVCRKYAAKGFTQLIFDIAPVIASGGSIFTSDDYRLILRHYVYGAHTGISLTGYDADLELQLRGSEACRNAAAACLRSALGPAVSISACDRSSVIIDWASSPELRAPTIAKRFDRLESIINALPPIAGGDDYREAMQRFKRARTNNGDESE